MTASVDEPTTIRFARGQRRPFDALARRRGISRSELLRQAVAAVLAAEQGNDVDGTVTVAGPHRVRHTLPVVSENAGEPARQARSVRNLATISGSCPDCGIRPTVEAPEFMRRLLPVKPGRVIASVSRPARSPGSTITTTTIVSNGQAVGRVRVVVRFDHRPGCAALGARTNKLPN
ncbi:MAG TPA: CopG family transcriptional regulator [Acidimicrobiales bacterium]